MNNRYKVFNIGFHKTGTTSLTNFMQGNGYKSLHSTAYTMQRLNLGSQSDTGDEPVNPASIENMLDKAQLQALVEEYDFFSDNPWPVLFKLLDEMFPGSRFILTRRNTNDWVRSLARHSGSQQTRMRQLIYGYGNPENHITHYRKVYLRHNRDVVEYFDNRKDLLIIDIEEDDRLIAESLAEFLGLENLQVPFPRSNKA